MTRNTHLRASLLIGFVTLAIAGLVVFAFVIVGYLFGVLP